MSEKPQSQGGDSIKLTIPRLTAGATVGDPGDLSEIESSQEAFDDLRLKAKKMQGGTDSE